MLLFVYGSLLSDQDNHSVIKSARFVGPARTLPQYTLVNLGPYPAITPRGTTAVVGELYEVEPDLLATLDEFEGHPDVYRRGPIELDENTRTTFAQTPNVVFQAYFFPVELAAAFPTVAGGDWRAAAKK